MWLINSSVGKKVVMSVTGISLILFLTFHGCMNVAAIFSKEAYNTICELLGANWYALVATLALAALAVIHFVYALILTLQNKKARGNNRYYVTNKPDKVEWASQNMFVLGLIIVIGILIHLKDFWYNMMFAEVIGQPYMGGHAPTDGYAYIQDVFGNPVFVGLYIVWFLAIWFHLTHGFWSAIQTLGWNGHIWFKRWRIIGTIYVTLIMLLFVAVALFFYLQSLGCCCCL